MIRKKTLKEKEKMLVTIIFSSPFPITFSKGFLYTVVKSRDCVVKSLFVLGTVFLLINAPRAMKTIDREPLFCTQFAK